MIVQQPNYVRNVFHHSLRTITIEVCTVCTIMPIKVAVKQQYFNMITSNGISYDVVYVAAAFSEIKRENRNQRIFLLQVDIVVKPITFPSYHYLPAPDL